MMLNMSINHCALAGAAPRCYTILTHVNRRLFISIALLIVILDSATFSLINVVQLYSGQTLADSTSDQMLAAAAVAQPTQKALFQDPLQRRMSVMSTSNMRRLQQGLVRQGQLKSAQVTGTFDPVTQNALIGYMQRPIPIRTTSSSTPMSTSTYPLKKPAQTPARSK